MTRDDLLTLVATSFSQCPQSVAGGTLFCSTPHQGDTAYLGRIYDPLSHDRAVAWLSKADQPGNPYRSFLTTVANGLNVANLTLYGVVEEIDRSAGHGIGQPISLDYGNLVERPGDLSSDDLVIGGMVGWSSRGVYVLDRDSRVRLAHPENGADVAAYWSDLEAMLEAEFARLAQHFNSEGRELSSHTALMHPNGRRWETEIEPGSKPH